MKIDPNAMKRQAGKAHQLLAAMANETRLLILCQLIDRERSVGEIAEFTWRCSERTALCRPAAKARPSFTH
jgi:DNA-binding transcriptional ArsR family regulator